MDTHTPLQASGTPAMIRDRDIFYCNVQMRGRSRLLVDSRRMYGFTAPRPTHAPRDSIVHFIAAKYPRNSRYASLDSYRITKFSSHIDQCCVTIVRSVLRMRWARGVMGGWWLPSTAIMCMFLSGDKRKTDNTMPLITVTIDQTPAVVGTGRQRYKCSTLAWVASSPVWRWACVTVVNSCFQTQSARSIWRRETPLSAPVRLAPPPVAAPGKPPARSVLIGTVPCVAEPHLKVCERYGRSSSLGVEVVRCSSGSKHHRLLLPVLHQTRLHQPLYSVLFLYADGLPVPAALKIHCSVLCRNILAKVGGYILEERGQVKVKGKGEMTTYWLVGEDPEWKRRREKTRRQRGFYPARNGCVGGGGGSSMGIGGGAARGSLRCVRTPASPLPNTLSLESQKFLKFTISDELGIHCTHEVATHEASPPAPASPASDDGGTMRRPALEAKRNSYPCIKESRDGPRRSRGQSLAGPRDDCPLLAHADLAPSPGSSFAGSGEEEALATSRRTSVSEVCASRPPSMIDHGGDGPPPTPGEPPPGPSRSNKNQSESHDAAHLSPSALDLVLATPPCSNVCGRTISGGGALTKPRYNLATGGGRWLPQGRRGSSTDGDNMSGVAAGNESSDGRTARLRYCGRQEGSSTAECEESAPLLAGVANYRIINELRTPRTQPERETPV
ncbi:Speract receptor [Portunus trituberculatus]|uniref:Speract receptor n=1 Tax=Portunus trituberculatus TaxID=210409 RepID=A0A5B7CUW3_PORTR|nr:Speract receptor [Portunus trituberculatus]